MNPKLPSLVMLFGQLSLLAFGGANVILPEMRRELVDVYGWISDADFLALFALAQAAPGPNIMIVPLIGWHVAGLPGALAAACGQFVPSALVVVVTVGALDRMRDRQWYVRLRDGLAPVTVGLVGAGAWSMTAAAAHSRGLLAVSAASALFSVAKGVHPLWLLLGGAVAGVLLASL